MGTYAGGEKSIYKIFRLALILEGFLETKNSSALVISGEDEKGFRGRVLDEKF